MDSSSWYTRIHHFFAVIVLLTVQVTLESLLNAVTGKVLATYKSVRISFESICCNHFVDFRVIFVMKTECYKKIAEQKEAGEVGQYLVQLYWRENSLPKHSKWSSRAQGSITVITVANCFVIYSFSEYIANGIPYETINNYFWILHV